MSKYLIEVPHGADKASCDKAIQVFLQTGSHFLTHADWGCHDGVHKAWIMADFKDKEEALRILPALFRPAATVTKLENFTAKDLVETSLLHKG